MTLTLLPKAEQQKLRDRCEYAKRKYREERKVFEIFWSHAWRPEYKQAAFNVFRKKARHFQAALVIGAVKRDRGKFMSLPIQQRPLMATYLDGLDAYLVFSPNNG